MTLRLHELPLAVCREQTRGWGQGAGAGAGAGDQGGGDWCAEGRGWRLGQVRGAGEVGIIEIMEIEFGGRPGGTC